MKRKIYTQLLKWKNSPFRKPLILKGARQVGKTYILNKFGENEFSNFHIYNFEKDKLLSTIFESNLEPVRIIKELSIYSGKKINIEKDIIIFDEIQESPKALNSLKYFCEEMPELYLCCAGSLIGITLSSESFPVGKVDFLQMYPMTFHEFLYALNDDISLEIYNELKQSKKQSDVSHDRLWEQLKEYFFTGGMPKVVASYVLQRKNQQEAVFTVRKIQQGLFESYFKDFAKHSGKINAMHISSVLEDIPMQLSKNIDASVKRYRFKGVIPGKKAYSDLQGPIKWLEKAGLLIKVKICNRAEIPFEAFCKNNIFKLYMFDIGILGAMLDLPLNAVVLSNIGISKGFFAENFVAQEMSVNYSKLYSWNESNSEIEFIKQIDGKIVPIEVKSGIRTQAKSLMHYIKRYSPENAIKITGKPLNKLDHPIIHNYPLYMAGVI